MSRDNVSAVVADSQVGVEDNAKPKPFLTLPGEIPIYFHQDWNAGIGGGLWSTGLALTQYLQTPHARGCMELLRPRRILELGSGNGLLAVCLAGVLCSYDWGTTIVATDLDDKHLQLIHQTRAANAHLFQIPSVPSVIVAKHQWGHFETDDPEILPAESFDLIVGSDLAYHENLYDILVASLAHFSHPKTITLLGVTMADTGLEFFDLLTKRGFTYRKLSEHLLSPEFRGTEFGIFVIQKNKDHPPVTKI